jgi:signal peptide peptidase sppA, 67K type
MITYFTFKDKNSHKFKNYNYVLFNVSQVTEDKIIGKGLFSGSEKYNISFMDILNSLDSIKENKDIKGIVIALDQVDLSSAKIEELNKKFAELKRNNKKIYAYGTYLENQNYPLATIADEIIMMPSASANVTLTGYNYTNLYYKKLLDNLGVNMEVVRIGNYKSYGENYIGDKMSDELKTELTRIFDNRYDKFINNIAKMRKIDKNTLDNDIVNGNNTSLTPFAARDKKLVDKLEGFQELTQRLGITDEKMVDIYDYYEDHSSEIEAKNKGNDAIAVIYAEGAIIDDSTANDNTISIAPDNIAIKLEKALETKNLKGIVLRVNSPGGSALASEIIYQTLLKAGVPIYVSMSETAASGGYYISMAGNKVFADNATITGSIGVVSMIPKFYNAQNKYGVTANSISKGKYSDMYNPFTPLTEETKTKISESMLSTYKEFKSRVSANRKIDDTILENYAQGKIWLGDEAKNIKLVDEIGGLEETINAMARDLKLKEGYRVENIYTEISFQKTLKMLSSFVLEKVSLTSQIQARLPKSAKLFDEYKLIEDNQNKPMYYLPYKLEF